MFTGIPTPVCRELVSALRPHRRAQTLWRLGALDLRLLVCLASRALEEGVPEGVEVAIDEVLERQLKCSV